MRGALALALVALAAAPAAAHEGTVLAALLTATVDLDQVHGTYTGVASLAIAGASGEDTVVATYECADEGVITMALVSGAFRGRYSCALVEDVQNALPAFELPYEGSFFGTAVALHGTTEPGGHLVVCRTVFAITGPTANGVTFVESGPCEVA